MILNTKTSVAPGTVNGTSFSFSGFGIVSGDAGLVAVAVVSTNSINVGAIPTAVTIGGTAAVKQAGSTTDANIDGSVSIWSCVLGGSPTDAVAVTYGVSVGTCGVEVLTLTGAASATATDTFETKAVSATSNTTGNLDTPTGGVMVLGGFYSNGVVAATFTGSSGVAIIEDRDVALEGSNGRLCVGHRSDLVIHTGETMTFTMASGTHFQHFVGASWSP